MISVTLYDGSGFKIGYCKPDGTLVSAESEVDFEYGDTIEIKDNTAMIVTADETDLSGMNETTGLKYEVLRRRSRDNAASAWTVYPDGTTNECVLNVG